MAVFVWCVYECMCRLVSKHYFGSLYGFLFLCLNVHVCQFMCVFVSFFQHVQVFVSMYVFFLCRMVVCVCMKRMLGKYTICMHWCIFVLSSVQVCVSDDHEREDHMNLRAYLIKDKFIHVHLLKGVVLSGVGACDSSQSRCEPPPQSEAPPERLEVPREEMAENLPWITRQT